MDIKKEDIKWAISILIALWPMIGKEVKKQARKIKRKIKALIKKRTPGKRRR